MSEPCGRYYGSDGTLCSTHNGRFARGWQGPHHCDYDDATPAASGDVEAAELLRPILSWAEAVRQHHAMLRSEPPFISTVDLNNAIEFAYAAIRAESAGTRSPYESLNEHVRQSANGTHLFDDNCYFCRAESAGALDVERLARAFHAAGIRCNPNIPYCRATHRSHATSLAAEYARLTEPTP